MPANDTVYDVIVVGAGNAALSAAIAAREQTQSVLVVEKAPEYFRGGNTYFTGGIIRFAYNGLDDIKGLIPDMSETEANSIEVGQYTENQFYDDMMRVTHGLSDPELAEILVSQSLSHHAVVAGTRRAFRAVIRTPGFPRRRQVPLLGRVGGGSSGRRQGPVRPAVRRLPEPGRGSSLRHRGRVPDPGPARQRGRPAGQGPRGVREHRRPHGGAGRRRV